MGNIKILDTGFISPTNEGTRASVSNIANGGTAISIKTAEFIPSLTRNFNTDPELSSNTPPEINIGSLESMKFTLRCVFNTDNSTDMSTVNNILQCVSTDGYKLLWYDYTVAAEDNNGQLIYQIALNSKFGHQMLASESTYFGLGGTAVPYHLHVHFNDLQLSHNGNNSLIIYNLNGIVLPVKVSQR